MNQNDTTASGDAATPGPSRRSVLGMLGAVPLAAGLGVAAGTASAAGTTSTAEQDDAASAHIPKELRPGGEFDRYLTELAERDEFSGTVLLRVRGRDVLARSHGMAHKEKQIPNGPDTMFTLGSVPKTMTAIAVTQLAAQGKIEFHERLGTYLDGFSDEVASTVTVHQLLTHTSGLTDFHRMPGFWEEAKTWDSVEETWAGCLRYTQQEQTLTFPAGYSNSAFFALGAIVAAVSDADSYYDYTRQHVFQVARMSGTDWCTLPEARDDQRIAHPYDKNDAGEWVDAIYEEPQMYVGTPAGGAFSTAADLAAFAEAVTDGTLLEPVWSQLATSPKTPIDQPGGTPFETYGAVWRISNGQRTLRKNGGTRGVSANVEWFPDTGWVAVVLSNYSKVAETVANRARDLIVAS